LIKKLDHIGIVVKKIEEALRVYHEALGLEVTDVRERPDLAAMRPGS
jgi:catechol 2,3-dioxygenase-like lactoylglutathione lyase family enzyme